MGVAMLKTSLLGIVLLAVVACARPQIVTPGPGEATLRGTVTYRERLALPVDAVLEVWVTDQSPSITVMSVVGETASLTDGRQVPLPFVLLYESRRIDPSHPYAVHAVIRHDGEILYATDIGGVPVITQGNPSEVMLVVSPPRD